MATIDKSKTQRVLELLEADIKEIWEHKDAETVWDLMVATRLVPRAVETTMHLLDDGLTRVAEPPEGDGGKWTMNRWVKQAVLLSFQLWDNKVLDDPTFYWRDKIPLRENWAGDGRVVPGAIVRHGSFIGPDTVLMSNAFVNIGGYVGRGTIIDTGARVGSCAQVGERVHLGPGSGIGGVLEPLQANPTILEDNVFVGAMCEVAEGVIVRKGAVLAMGTKIGASTKILDRATGRISYGEIPPYSVVVPGVIMAEDGTHGLNGAIIVKTVDEQTRAKVAINDLLRSS